MMKVGITGGIGSGKSTVTQIFKVLGIPAYDADSRAKELMIENDEVKQKIVVLLGEKSYHRDGSLNRVFIAEKIFSNAKVRIELNKIVHPAVHDDFRQWASKHQDLPYVLDEAALIFESGGHLLLDRIILVTAPEETRIQRVMARNKLSKEEVIGRIQAQLGDHEKIPLSDYIIVNDGQSSLVRQVLEIHQLLLAENM